MTTTTAKNLHFNLLSYVAAVWQHTDANSASIQYQGALSYFRKLQQIGEKPEDKYDGVLAAAYNYIRDLESRKSLLFSNDDYLRCSAFYP